MKEFTEIRIENVSEEMMDKILQSKILGFDRNNSNTLRTRYLGRPISFEGNILILDTQMYYDNIPLKDMNSDTEVIIYKNSRKEIELARGIIYKKYYIQATENDWKSKKHPIIYLGSDNSLELKINLQLTEKEKEALELGEIPLSMDDRHFKFSRNNRFHVIYSWTSKEIYGGEITKIIDSDMWLIDVVKISKEWVRNYNEENIVEGIKLFIRRRMALLS